MPRRSRSSLPAPEVREFRERLAGVLSEVDEQGRTWANAQWGVYAFYDYDGEPIYVGQTNERLRSRVRRHLTNQRTDAVAMRVLDTFEVAELALYPLWHLEGTPSRDTDAKQWLNRLEYSVYIDALRQSKYRAILNEVIPPAGEIIELPPCLRRSLVSDESRSVRGHPDTRIARRAETLSRLADVVYERGEVSDGLRRVLVIQAIRIAHLSATRLARIEAREAPPADAIDTGALVGSVLEEALGGPGSEDDEHPDVDLAGLGVNETLPPGAGSSDRAGS